MAREPGSLVVCTCSTLGGCAERANEDRPGVAMRIDWPMAERAVLLGQRILIAATLESTLEPTHSLVEDAARSAGREIRTRALLCDGAWAHFERGDAEGYHRAIAQALRQGVRDTDTDVVVLAQASMAPAAALCAHLSAPVLSSPRLGIAQALARYRSR